MLTVLRRLQNDDIAVTGDALRTELDRIYRASKNLTAGAVKTPEEGAELIPFIRQFIQTAHTIANYRSSCHNLEDYQKERKVILSFQNIDMDFYDDYITFLKCKNYAPNMVRCRIRTLKKFMNTASDRGYMVREDYKKKGFANPSEETVAVYLNETELMQMYRLDLSDNLKLEAVRDLFLIGCYTDESVN